MPPPSININLQLGDDASHPRRPPVRDLQLTSKKRTLRSAAAASAVEPAMRSTSRLLESLLLTSNKLRQKAESSVAGLEAVPRTKAIEHALVNQTAGSAGSS